MSTTLDNLVRLKTLIPWRPDLGPRRHSKRRLFVTKEFAAWAYALPDTLDTSRQRLVQPKVELNEAAASFVAGDKIVTFLHRIDPPKGQGVIRLNTPSFRLAGWCPAPQTFILAQGALADATHGEGGRLTLVGRKVVEIREDLGFTTWENGQIYELFRAEG